MSLRGVTGSFRIAYGAVGLKKKGRRSHVSARAMYSADICSLVAPPVPAKTFFKVVGGTNVSFCRKPRRFSSTFSAPVAS